MIEAKYDDRTVPLTDRFLLALMELMEAECEMMIEYEASLSLDDDDCWTWGRAKIVDLSKLGGIEFTYGGDEDLPDDGFDSFAVLVP